MNLETLNIVIDNLCSSIGLIAEDDSLNQDEKEKITMPLIETIQKVSE